VRAYGLSRLGVKSSFMEVSSKDMRHDAFIGEASRHAGLEITGLDECSKRIAYFRRCLHTICIGQYFTKNADDAKNRSRIFDCGTYKSLRPILKYKVCKVCTKGATLYS